jgi:hypothetical protein
MASAGLFGASIDRGNLSLISIWSSTTVVP